MSISGTDFGFAENVNDSSNLVSAGPGKRIEACLRIVVIVTTRYRSSLSLFLYGSILPATKTIQKLVIILK